MLHTVVVLELEEPIYQWRCSEVERCRLSVHETTHHQETEEDLRTQEDVVYQVHWHLMREFEWHNNWDDAEGEYKEDCENDKGDHLRELK